MNKTKIEIKRSMIYHAGEVDAVLAEKVSEERSAKVDYKISAYDLNDELIKTYKEIKRHKYKRCLTMAKLCAKNVDHLNSEGYIYEKENHLDDLDDCIKGTNFYHKWYKRWLQIAEAYK